jgi:hydrogenase-4 component B
VSDPTLLLLVLLVAALATLGAVEPFVARGRRQAVGLAGACLGGLGFLLTLLALAIDQEPDSLLLPFGLPGVALGLRLDPLAAFFLLPSFLAGTAGIAFAAESGDSAAKSSVGGLMVGLGGVVLAMLAADAVALTRGLALAGGSIWASEEPGRARALHLAVTGLGAVAVLAATASSGFTFAAMREHSAYPTVLYLLTLIGLGALAGQVPFYRATAVASAAMQPLALYLMTRLLLDAGGSAPPFWWGVPLLIVGSATALTGAWRAASETEIGNCLSGLAERQGGLAAIGIGLALIGRATDLPALTTLAVEAAMLLAFSQAICGTLAQLVAGAVLAEAGSRRLVLLGGLVHSMPYGTAAMGAALFGFSALPAGAGFAALWLLFQALLAAPRSPALALVAAALAVSAALSGAAVLRLFGVAFLGRPRGPRAAAATDIAKAARPGMLVLAGVAVLTGLFPGLLTMLADPAIRQLGGAGVGDRAGYPVLPLVLLALVVCACIVGLLRRRRGLPPRVSTAWADGFAPSPAWMPFGDSLTESAGEGFLPKLPPMPSIRRTGMRWRIQALPVLLAAMAVFLGALLWAAGP